MDPAEVGPDTDLTFKKERKKTGADRQDIKPNPDPRIQKFKIRIREPSTPDPPNRQNPVRFITRNELWIFLGQPVTTVCPRIMRLTCVSEGIALVLVGQDPLGEQTKVALLQGMSCGYFWDRQS